jgi:hypothetical protein
MRANNINGLWITSRRLPTQFPTDGFAPDPDPRSKTEGVKRGKRARGGKIGKPLHVTVANAHVHPHPMIEAAPMMPPAGLGPQTPAGLPIAAAPAGPDRD